MIENILLSFIPIFVAVDALGLLPVFLGLTQELDREKTSSVIRQSMITALLLTLGFLLVGEFVFRLLGITAADFLLAGGTILFILAVRDLIQVEKGHRLPVETLGAVPLGTPLVAGPAVLTTTLIMKESYGWFPTVISVSANILLAGAVFSSSNLIVRLLGGTGIRVVSKITALFLAAIGVLMVRRGLSALL